MENISDFVSDYLGIEKNIVLDIASKAPQNYRMYKIPKKKEGYRYIYHPAKETKAIQYAIMNILLSKLKVHEIVTGYIKGRRSPLRYNAEQHAKYNYSIHIDIKNFFPSIIPNDLFHTIETNKPDFNMNEEDKHFLKNSLFIYKHSGFSLSIGAPSSPMISNCVMYDIDCKIFSISKALATESSITRYADDIYFSCNKKGLCNDFYNEFAKLLENEQQPNLSINHKKTYYSSKGTRRRITGLNIDPSGSVGIPKSKKNEIKKQLYLLSKNEELSVTPQSLLGYLSFIQDVDPDFYNKLIIKYGIEVINKLKMSVKEL